MLSLNWFRKTKKEELTEQQLENEKLRGELLKQELEDRAREKEEIKGVLENWQNTPLMFEQEQPKKLYSFLSLTDDTLTCVLLDGTNLSKPKASKEDFINIKNAQTEQDIIDVFVSKEHLQEQKKKEREAEKMRALQQGFDLLLETGDFEVKDNSVYMKNINRSLPELLVEEFIVVIGGTKEQMGEKGTLSEWLKENLQYQGLKNFWFWVILNPNPHASEDLFTFLKRGNIKINKNGHFFTYRRVVLVDDRSSELVDFVSNAYNKIKAVWKKKPSTFEVFKNENGELKFTNKPNALDGEFTWENLGNLEELYLDLPNLSGKKYTDNHTRTYDYRPNATMEMPRDLADENHDIECSKGFHSGNKQFGFDGFGEQQILVLLNPKDVVAVPKHDSDKIRTCRWHFVMTLDRDEQFILDEEDFDITEIGDNFAQQELENLEEKVKEAFVQEINRHTFEIPQVSATDISNSINLLQSIKDRLVTVA